IKTSIAQLEKAEKSGEEIVLRIRDSGQFPMVLDSADIRVVTTVARFVLDEMRVYTAWDLTGLVSLAKYMEKERTHAQIIAKLAKMEDFLILRSDNELGEIRNSLEASVQAVMDLDAMSDVLCRNKERESHLFLSICLGKDMMESMSIATDVLKGATVEA